MSQGEKQLLLLLLLLLHTWDVKTDGRAVIRATVPILSCLEG
jgi:hypothetical protein